MLQVHRILYATDFSPRSRRAFELACALARDYGAELVVCHVSPPAVTAVSDGELVEIPTGAAEQTMARLRRVRPDGPAICVKHVLERGDEAAGILRAASASGADLIVMGTHGRTGLPRVLVGSVAEAVLRKAPCPVLTVKVPVSDAEEPDLAAAGQIAGRSAG